MRDLVDLHSPVLWTALAALGAWAAVIAATWYAALTRRLFQIEQTPVVVAVREKRADLRNVGRGPALNIFLYWDSQYQSLGQIAAGRDLSSFHSPTPLEGNNLPTSAFVLYYMDVAGSWHATKIVPDGNHFQNRFFRNVGRRVPTAIKRRALAISAWEMLQGLDGVHSDWERLQDDNKRFFERD